MIEIGQKIPDFSISDEKGELVSSESLLGQKYILFFYPKDDSPSCTKEACSIRDHYKSIIKLGYQIFGVSPDNEKKHKKFIDKYEFQYPLLADTELEMTKSFGLYGPKKFMGKDIIGVYRTTVIVNESGIITHIIDNVKTATHGEQILELLG
ncbi:MAG TPA: peroxiredoxin [Saprospiraceae bacterium]|nr:peroxiredoxin [Saprospiraceae bacterium]